MAGSAVLPVAHAEWIKIKSLRSSLISLLVIFAVTLAITVLASATIGQAEAADPDAEPLFDAFYAFNFGQIAAISFGTTAVASEYTSGALRISLAAVPRRGLFYGSKMMVIGGLALLAGLVTSFATFLTSQAFMGEYAIGLGHPGAVRACVGGGIYLSLMALLAGGLTAVLRSGVAVLSVLIPFTLIVSFVVGDVADGAAGFLPDKAGQQVLHEAPTGSVGPLAGLAVCAAWTAVVLLAGWWAVRRRDA